MPPLEVLDAPFERVEAIDAVWRAIEALNVDLKMALLLRDVVGLSYTEIADSLEITLATVKWRIYKAREEVQLALAREGITFGSMTRPHGRSGDLGPQPRGQRAGGRPRAGGRDPVRVREQLLLEGPGTSPRLTAAIVALTRGAPQS